MAMHKPPNPAPTIATSTCMGSLSCGSRIVTEAGMHRRLCALTPGRARAAPVRTWQPKKKGAPPGRSRALLGARLELSQGVRRGPAGFLARRPDQTLASAIAAAGIAAAVADTGVLVAVAATARCLATLAACFGGALGIIGKIAA